MSKSVNTKPAAKQGKHDVAVVAASSQSVVYSGPLPPASEMAQYEKVYPGAAERIIRMAEKQAEHRQNIEHMAVWASSWRSILGVVFAFFITIGALTLSGVCFYLEYIKTGCAIFGTTLATVVGTFIYGTNSDKQEREEKFTKAHQMSKPSE